MASVKETSKMVKNQQSRGPFAPFDSVLILRLCVATSRSQRRTKAWSDAVWGELFGCFPTGISALFLYRPRHTCCILFVSRWQRLIAFDKKPDILSNIGRVIANPFKIFCHEQKMRTWRDITWVFHHIGE